jgi:hypothetical protein
VAWPAVERHAGAVHARFVNARIPVVASLGAFSVACRKRHPVSEVKPQGNQAATAPIAGHCQRDGRSATFDDFPLSGTAAEFNTAGSNRPQDGRQCGTCLLAGTAADHGDVESLAREAGGACQTRDRDAPGTIVPAPPQRVDHLAGGQLRALPKCSCVTGITDFPPPLTPRLPCACRVQQGWHGRRCSTSPGLGPHAGRAVPVCR